MAEVRACDRCDKVTPKFYQRLVGNREFELCSDCSGVIDTWIPNHKLVGRFISKNEYHKKYEALDCYF